MALHYWMTPQQLVHTLSDYNELHAQRLIVAKKHCLDAQVQKLAEEMQAIWIMALETARETCDQAQQEAKPKNPVQRG